MELSTIALRSVAICSYENWEKGRHLSALFYLKNDYH